MTVLEPQIIIPDWPAPASVKSAISTRTGGVSKGVYASCNLALHVGDDAGAVAQNRAAFMEQAGVPADVQWLTQIHGTRIVEAERNDRTPTADGVITASSALACAVLTADCLPILLCSGDGKQVGAVHGGWRGLASGILRDAISQFIGPRSDLMVYLGPAIGPQAFEVGVDVLEAFFDNALTPEHADAIAQAFYPGLKPLHFRADLYALARAECKALEVDNVYGGEFCTYSDAENFFSYRRDGETGRMASMIWLAE